jgi:hypothetical protein
LHAGLEGRHLPGEAYLGCYRRFSNPPDQPHFRNLIKCWENQALRVELMLP